MKVPISWLKEYVEISLPIEELAYKLTVAGLEVEEIRYVGLPLPQGKGQETKITGVSWGPEEIVVGEGTLLMNAEGTKFSFIDGKWVLTN